MKIIDEKGRFFGKINAIDFLVIVFLFCILPAFYFGYKILSKKPELVKGEFLEIELECKFIKVLPEFLQVISVGDKELAWNEEVIGEIISLDESKPYKYRFNIGKGQRILEDAANLREIDARLKLKADVIGNLLYYKNELVRINSPLKFKTNKYSLTAVPFCGQEEEKKAILEVKFKNLMPEVCEVIKAGDREIRTLETDTGENILASVVRVVSNEPAEVIKLVEDRGTWNIIGHPKYRDLFLEIETSCIRGPEGLFQKNRSLKTGGNIEYQALKVGEKFKFQTDLYFISGTIIGLKPK